MHALHLAQHQLQHALAGGSQQRQALVLVTRQRDAGDFEHAGQKVVT
jgi:hypothetical protein